MITNIRIVQVESKVYLPVEEIAQIRNIHINNEIAIIKAQTTKNHRDEMVLRCDYSFNIIFLNPSAGHIRFSGTADYSGEDISDKSTADTLSAETRNEIINAIFQNTAPIALLLSKVQGLPPAIPLPRIEVQKKEEQSYYHG